MKVFLGYDAREAAGSYVFMNSLLSRASVPVEFSFVPGVPAVAAGVAASASNAFTYSRYLCAHRVHYAGGPIVFADGADQVCLADIAELRQLWQPDKAVQVVKRPPYAATPNKYVGTPMASPNSSYPCKNWSSFMLISPGHYGWRRVDFSQTAPDYWHGFGWLSANEIGELPEAWNRLVDEGDPTEGAKIMHWTLGIPAMSHYASAPGSDAWRAEARKALNVCDPRWTRQIEALL